MKQALPLQVRMDLEVMTIKEYFTFPKAPGLEAHHQMQVTCWWQSYSSAEMQSAYSLAPVDEAD